MNILILGSGGRESAFAWKISQSKLLTKLYIAPGNPFTTKYGQNIPISILDFEKIGQICLEYHIDMVLVGPEAPLVSGIYDYFANVDSLKHIAIIGPSKQGAMLEGSKDFAKKFMLKYQIPTAAHKTFDKSNIDEGIEFLEKIRPPYVLKADGPAAGKGVIITSALDEAKHTLRAMIEQLKFGDASSKVVIEEFLNGIEVSFFVLTDGHHFLVLPEAKDYKRIGENDTGPNTGGMGAVSPVYFADNAFKDKVLNEIILPTVNGLKNENIVYKGFIFIGLMNVNGQPYVIEYNCRMGDPETQVVLPRIKNDFVSLLLATKNNLLHQEEIQTDENFCITTVVASGGYPGDFKKGLPVYNTEKIHDAIPFHSGTDINTDGVLVTSAGRVMSLSAMASTLDEAKKLSLKAAATIEFEGKYYRTDIGNDLM